MLIAQLSDPHIKLPGRLAYGKVDTASMLAECVAMLDTLRPAPDLILLTGDLVDFGRPEEYAHLRRILAPLKSPLVAIPGNHDEREAMRAAFIGDGYLPATGFLQFVIDDYPVRLIGLDTVIPGEGGGELCAERLAWLDAALNRRPDAPTIVMLHHPPFLTGIAHMDRLGLRGRPEFAETMARHPQVERIVSGHLHRPIQAVVGGRLAMIAPSTAHQVELDLDQAGPSCFRMEPPGILLHWWNDGTLVSHYRPIGSFAGPYPFFGPDGRLIE
jgi:Icc protein